jgi:hypothetical protein
VVPALAAVLVLVLVSCARPAATASRPTARWSQGRPLPPSFIPRWDVTAAAFPPKGQVILFGGAPKLPTETWRNDTWVYSGGTWSPGPPPPPGLTPRGGVAMAYFPTIRRVVLFGGGDGRWPPALTDTWLYDGVSWAPGPAAPPGLLPREGAGLVYDPAIRRLVLLAGSGLTGYSDTWLFDGVEWTPGPPAPAGMPPREFFGMAYDPSMGKVVAAGGSGRTDVWSFDGSTWAKGPDLEAGPLERVHMAFDPRLGGIVLIGGIGPGAATDEAWLLRAGAWTRVETPAEPRPDPRLDAQVVWFAERRALLVVAGVADTPRGDVAFADTWFLE